MTDWHGAQWVLATIYVCGTAIRIAFLPVKFKSQDWPSLALFAGHAAAPFLDDIAIIAILWWGGFWS